MKINQVHLVEGKWINGTTTEGFNSNKAQLVLAFGSTGKISDPLVFQYLKTTYPAADIVTASTSGEILGNGVFDETVAVTAIEFDKTTIKTVSLDITNHQDSYNAGLFLMSELRKNDQPLKGVFVISDGAKVNGSELVNGLNFDNTDEIAIMGGLAGDAANFEKTYTGLNIVPTEGNLIGIGFYGNNIRIGHGSFGGWDEFGKERTITKSDKNVLYEIDGRSALDLYKEYLGPYADELPGSALLFPLSIKISSSDKNLVRTILSIDETNKSMTFAGNLPEGSKVRLMKANFEKLIDAASTAATYSINSSTVSKTELTILISCVGRKLILQERTAEEVEAAIKVIGKTSGVIGFYSYGEISPFNPGVNCELHNQTMTITTLTEA